jgi:hypothetical protein
VHGEEVAGKLTGMILVDTLRLDTTDAVFSDKLKERYNLPNEILNDISVYMLSRDAVLPIESSLQSFGQQ